MRKELGGYAVAAYGAVVVDSVAKKYPSVQPTSLQQ